MSWPAVDRSGAAATELGRAPSDQPWRRTSGQAAQHDAASLRHHQLSLPAPTRSRLRFLRQQQPLAGSAQTPHTLRQASAMASGYDRALSGELDSTFISISV